MSEPPATADLFPATAAGPIPGAVFINRHCLIRSDHERRVVVARGFPVAVFAATDRMAEAYAMVLLVDQSLVQQAEVAKAFGCTTRTVRRCQARFVAGGLAALSRQPGYPTERRRRQPGRDQRVVALRRSGLSNRAIGRRLGVNEKTVRKALRRSGWQEPRPAQQFLDLGAGGNLSSVASEVAVPADLAPARAAPGRPPRVAGHAGQERGGGRRVRPRMTERSRILAFRTRTNFVHCSRVNPHGPPLTPPARETPPAAPPHATACRASRTSSRAGRRP